MSVRVMLNTMLTVVGSGFPKVMQRHHRWRMRVSVRRRELFNKEHKYEPDKEWKGYFRHGHLAIHSQGLYRSECMRCIGLIVWTLDILRNDNAQCRAQ